MPGHFEDTLEHRLDHFKDALLLRERHLDIDLRELGLAVGAEVFIAEAAHDLEIFVVAADHQQLLEDLRRLRQSVEAAGLDAAGDQIIARAFGRRARHERRFDFEKALAVEMLAHGEADLRAQHDIALHVRAPQVDVAVFQARVFLHVDGFFHGERRRARFVQDPDLLGYQLHFAGFERGIHGFGRACGNAAFDSDDVLGAQRFGLGVEFRAAIGVEDNLRNAVAVAQMNEDDAAQIAAAMHPAH